MAVKVEFKNGDIKEFNNLQQAQIYAKEQKTEVSRTVGKL